MYAAAALTLSGLVVQVLVLVFAMQARERTGARPLLLLGLAGGALPFLFEGLLTILATPPNVHGIAFVGWLGFILASGVASLLFVTTAGMRRFRRGQAGDGVR